MKRAGLLITVALVAGGGIDTASAAPAASPREIASAVAGHQGRIIELVDLEQTCRSVECMFADARLDRAEALARESLALSDELVDLTGKAAKRAPGRLRPLVRKTTRHADDVVDEYEIWVTCVNANDGTMSACSSYETSFGQLRSAWAPLLDRWAPYI